MREPAEQLGLADEVPPGVLGRAGLRGDVVLRVDHLNGDQAIAQWHLFREIHLSHGARADLTDQPAAAQFRPVYAHHC